MAGDALVALVNQRAVPELRTGELVALFSSRPAGWLARCETIEKGKRRRQERISHGTGTGWCSFSTLLNELLDDCFQSNESCVLSAADNGASRCIVLCRLTKEGSVFVVRADVAAAVRSLNS